MSHPAVSLKALLERISARQRRLSLWLKLGACWTAAAFLGLAIFFLEQGSGWVSSLSMPIIAASGLLAALVVLARHRKAASDWRELAGQIEARHPELEGRLLTAVQQPFDESRLNYLQQRLIEETLAHGQQADWAGLIPRSR